MSDRFALVDYDNEEEGLLGMEGNSAAANTRAAEDLDKLLNSRSHKVNRSNQSSISRKQSPPARKYGDRASPSTRRSGPCEDDTSGRKTDKQRRSNEEREGISTRPRNDSPGRRESGNHPRYDRNHRHVKRSRSRTPEKRKHYSERDYDYSRDHDSRNRDYSTRADNRHRNNRDRGRDPREFEDKMKRMYPTKQLSEEEMAKLPSYINPRNVNITKVIEQQEKRKLLWQSHKAKKEEQGSGLDKGAAMWQQATFSGDTDGAVATKFRKLMGLKTETRETAGNGDAPSSSSVELPDTIRNQEEIMRNLDRQYETARLSAHTQRGIGLGFNTR